MTRIAKKVGFFKFLSSGLANAFCLFNQNATPIIEKVCVQFQAQKPLIHIMQPMILDFFKELLSRFVKPDIIKNCSLPINVDYHTMNNQRKNSDIVIGTVTQEVVALLSEDEKKIFFRMLESIM